MAILVMVATSMTSRELDIDVQYAMILTFAKLVRLQGITHILSSRSDTPARLQSKFSQF
jgi:hypothetical protein